MSKQLYIVHVVAIDHLAIDIDKVDVIEQVDDTHFIVETMEEGEKGPVEIELGFDAAETLEDAYNLVLKRIHDYYTDAMSQLKQAFKRVLQNSDTMDAISGKEGLTESEYIAREGALVASAFTDLGFDVQMCLIKFMRLAREEAD